MTMNYYLAWLHFDSRGRMSTRLPDGHRVLEVLHHSSSNRHPPALWVLVEAVVATPSYTPPAGFPSSGEAPVEYRTPSQPMTHPIPVVPPRDYRSETGEFRYREQADADRNGFEYREQQADGSQDGRTQYPEPPLSPITRDDDYRQNYVAGVPMSPARM